MATSSLLISDYLDGALADEDVECLGRLLEAEPDTLDRFVLHSFVHAQLADWMDQQRGQGHFGTVSSAGSCGLREITACEESAAAIDDVLNSRWPSAEVQHRGRQRWWWLPRSVPALAASLLIAASIAVLTYVFASRPVIVGQLTQANECRWASTTNMSVGTLLKEGQEVQLEDGSALITFVNGAQMLLEGSTSLRLDSAGQVYLYSGRVAAKVPTPARGFAVASSLARFVDLGTAFTLKLDADQAFDLHVFEGLVELQLDERFGEAARLPLRVAQVRAVHFDVASGDVATLHFQEGKQMPF